MSIETLAMLDKHLESPHKQVEVKLLGISPTKREREVAQLISLMDRHIADRLCISIKTVEKHIGNLHKKFGSHSKAELILKMILKSYLKPEEFIF